MKQKNKIYRTFALHPTLSSITSILLTVLLLPQASTSLAAINDVPGGIEIIGGVSTSSNTPEAVLAGVCEQIVADGNANAQLLQICTILINPATDQTDPQVVAAYKQLSARSVTAMTSLLSHGSLLMSMEDISSRLAALRRAARNQSSAALSGNRSLAGLMTPNATGGGASADPQGDVRLSRFISGAYIDSQQTETDTLAGFDSTLYGATIGMDYRLSRESYAGFATRLLGGETTLENDGGRLSSRDTNLTYYGTYFPSQSFYLEGTLQLSKGKYDLSRKIDFTLPGPVVVRETAEGSTEGKQVGFTVGAGYESYLSSLATTAQLSSKFRYNKAHLDGYTETGASGINLELDDQTIHTRVFSLGGQLSKAISYNGGVIIPQLDLVWKHDFATQGQDIGARFVSDPSGTRFVFRTDERDADYYELSLGLSSISVGGMTSFIQFTSLLGYDNYEQNLLSLGVRQEF